jgi:hypothetical protein
LPAAAIQIFDSWIARGILHPGINDYKGLCGKINSLTATDTTSHEGNLATDCEEILLSSENAHWIDNYEYTAAAGEDGPLLVDYFGDTREAPPAFADLSRLNLQSIIQRHRPAIFDGHARCGGDDVTKLAEFAHGIVKDGCDDPAMAVTGRSGVAFAQAKMRDEMVALTIQKELQMHSVRVVLAASKTQVLLHRIRLVAVPAGRSLTGHR